MPAGRAWPLIFGMVANLAVAGQPPAGPSDERGRPPDRAQPPPRPRVFRIQVVDEETGRGVPLVELKTVNQVRSVTDSNGIVAFDEPGLFNRKVFFFVSSHGYEAAKDNFGYRGAALDVTEGGSARIAIQRRNIAQRLYRVTGAGIYRDSTLTGDPIPIREPLLNGRVFGQDSVVNAEYQGKIFWFWGDTNRPDYPLGNFHVPGATSERPVQGGLDPDAGVNLSYFLDERGFARPTAPLPGEGPTWISGLVVLPDRDAKPRMFATYVKVRNLLQVYQHGLVEFRPETQRFEKVVQFPDAPAYPGDYPTGHPFLHREKGVEYLYYANPYPLIRVPADPERLKDPASFEAYTCLKRGTRRAQQQLDRGPGGVVRYAWKPNTQVVPQDEQTKLIAAGRMKPEEALLNLRDIETGKTVLAHGGSLYWNAYRGRWVMIAVESFGSTSFLGEVWFAEADTPMGPWVFARKIVSHEKYSFYNPKQHPMFDKENGRIIYFEGTYTATFSGNPDPTPRYDYNQVMYRLDLSDGRLALPVAIYEVPDGRGGRRLSPKAGPPAPLETATRQVAFFAPDREGIATLPVFEQEDAAGGQTLRVGIGNPREKSPAHRPLFFILPPKGQEPIVATVSLYEYQEGTDERRFYSVKRPGGNARNVKVLGRVWRNPARLRLW